MTVLRARVIQPRATDAYGFCIPDGYVTAGACHGVGSV